MRKGILVFIALSIIFSLGGAAPAADPANPPIADYLAYARAAAQHTWEHYDEIVARWRERFDPESVFGYQAPGALLEMAVIYAYLYEKEHRAEYAERAKHVLLTYGDFRAAYPEHAKRARPDYLHGVPALPNFFTVMRYVRAYDTLHRLGELSADEVQEIEDLIAHSIDYCLQTAEWGPMNRTILRAESIAWAVRALPNHPRAHIWDMQRQALADDNWGNWEIEDATIYHGVWLYALLGYADCRGGISELFRTPEVYYYAHYFLNLMCPAGMIPDFGDARWLDNRFHYLVFFETAAKQLKLPELKWAANTIREKYVDFDNPTSAGLGYMLLDCYRWGTDHVSPKRPTTGSQEVMEDVQGKKIVLRSGWDEAAAYLLLSYRDEGDGGLNFRDYLRDTIPVEEEKMTHGHADENAIALLMQGGSLLLHDGGYRDYMPSGPFGAYRQDYFHNRLCVRPEKIWMGQREGEFRYSIRDAVPGQSILEFLHNAGSYRTVRTQKVDFLTLPDFDYSRTRLRDETMGYEWDRVICYVKDPGLFVVFDIFKARTEDYFTLANLWHTRKILAQGETWFDTVYDQVAHSEYSTNVHTFPQDHHLLVVFPDTHFRLTGTESEKRHYQDEILIHQTTAHHFELAETDAFVTVLWPHPAGEAPAILAENIHLAEVTPAGAGIGILIKAGSRNIIVGAKQDLRMDMCRDWRRPRYTYTAGKIRFEDLESNGDFAFAVETDGALDYTIVNMTKATYGDQLLYEVSSSFYGLAFDASPETKGFGKVRYWRAHALLEK